MGDGLPETACAAERGGLGGQGLSSPQGLEAGAVEQGQEARR